jgi:hypothetical protein
MNVTTSSETTLPYVELTRHNLYDYADTIARLMRNATYIAMDCEFTGLGLTRKETRDRYV